MSAFDLCIIPEPKEMTLGESTVRLGPNFNVYATTDAYGAADTLAKALGRDSVGTLVDDVPVVVVAREMPTGRQEPSSVDHPEGYDLDISAGRVLVRGADAAGAFYGVQTVLQMLADSGELPLGEIRDWPDMDVRGVHFDLKGAMPTFAYLKAAIERLAHFKINTVLMEYEDRLAYPNHSILAVPSALSVEQARQLERVARENFVQIVPLLQCLGHAEYILRHPEYAHLRETDDHIQQMCPSKPATFEFFKERAEHLMALHPDTVYFHAGGDETRQLGECPECRAAVNRAGPYRLYFDYVRKCCDYLAARNRRPIIWDDILTRHAPNLLTRLPESTVVMYWIYRITSPAQAHVYYGPGATASDRWRHKPYGPTPDLPGRIDATFEDLSPGEFKSFAKYAGTDDFPATLSSTVFLRMMQDAGVAVMGGSAAQASFHGLVADPDWAIPNIRTWASAIHEADELGVVSTAWTRSHSNTPLNGIMEGMWYPFLASAEWYWSAEGVDERRFDEKVNRRLFGLDGLEATDAIWFLRRPGLAPAPVHEVFADLADRAGRNADLLTYYGVMSEVLRLNESIHGLVDRMHYPHYASRALYLSLRDRRGVEQALADCKQRLGRLRPRVADVYARSLHPYDVKDCVASLFDWPEDVIEYMTQALKTCP